MINYGYSYNTPPNITTNRTVAITGVNAAARTATGMTRERSEVEIDCSHPVGGMLVTPAIGEQWDIHRVGLAYALLNRRSAYSQDLLIDVVPGQVQVGSTGPLTLHGSEVQVDSYLRLGSTLYRDAEGTLQRSTDEGQTWTPVCTCGTN